MTTLFEVTVSVYLTADSLDEAIDKVSAALWYSDETTVNSLLFDEIGCGEVESKPTPEIDDIIRSAEEAN
jgi:hypothetical protein